MTIWQGNLAKPNVVHRTPFFRFWLQKFRIAIQTRECAKNCFWARAVCALSRPSLSAALGRMRSAKSRPCHSVRPRPSHRSQPNADGGSAAQGEKPEKQHLVIFGKIGERVRENCLAKTFWWHLWSCWRRGFCYSHGFTWWRPGCALGGAQMTISDSGNCYFTTKPSRTLVQLSNLDLTWVSRSEQLEPKQAWIFLQI